MSQKSSDLEKKLDDLYKELFDVQFYDKDPYKEQNIIKRIRILEENESPMEAYRESVRADGATI
jgi:hypothetical protein